MPPQLHLVPYKAVIIETCTPCCCNDMYDMYGMGRAPRNRIWQTKCSYHTFKYFSRSLVAYIVRSCYTTPTTAVPAKNLRMFELPPPDTQSVHTFGHAAHRWNDVDAGLSGRFLNIHIIQRSVNRLTFSPHHPFCTVIRVSGGGGGAGLAIRRRPSRSIQHTQERLDVYIHTRAKTEIETASTVRGLAGVDVLMVSRWGDLVSSERRA